MGSNRSGIQLAIETDNDYRIEVGDGASNWIWQSTGFDSKSRKWTHFALTREGSTFRAFEDGVLLGTQTSSTAVEIQEVLLLVDTHRMIQPIMDLMDTYLISA